MERMMRFALENKVLVLILIGLIAGLGVWSTIQMPIDAFPDVTNIQVEVLSNAPGLSPLEIERFVTYPVETSMRGLPGLVKMRSITKYGLSVVTLVFRDDVDIYAARQQVFERLSSVDGKLPPGIKTEMGPVATAMGEIYQYTFEGAISEDEKGKVQHLTELRTLQDWVVAPLLKGVSGVNEVNSFGGFLKEYQVVVNPDQLIKFKLSINDVFRAVGENNQNVGGGFINKSSEQFIIRGLGLAGSESDIQNIMVKSHDGIPIYVKDVAEVKIGFSPRQGMASQDGKGEAVGGIVMMLRGQNSMEVVRNVEAKIREINSSNVLPPGLKIRPYYVRSDLVGKSIKTVTRTLLEGSLLVIIVLYLLLRNLRGAIAVILALPLSILLTFTVMRALGLSANLMSLGGLAISIGMIIDATIIQVENVQRHLGELTDRSKKLKTVLRAVMEVRKPSIFGELIIALTFVPIIMLSGYEGKMFSPLAFTVAIALLSSLFLSIFVIPVLCLAFLRQGDEKENPLLVAIKKAYFPILNLGLRAPALVIAISLFLIMSAALLIPRLGTEFIPVMDEGAFDMDVQLLPGVSLEKSAEVSSMVQKKLMRFPELVTLVSRTGQTGIALEARGVDKTGFTGVLKPRSEWTSASSKEELISQMRAALAGIPGMAFSFSQPIQCRIDELVAGTRTQIIMKLFGENVDVLREKTAEIARVVSRIPGVADLVVEKVSGQPYIAIQVDRSKIARYGLNVSDVLQTVEIAIGGKSATQVYEENRSFDLTVRVAEERRDSVDKISNLLVQAGNGMSIPLRQVADISMEEGPVQISREDGQRRMGIEINISGRDIGSFVADAQQEIRRKVSLPVGYTINWGGQFENQQEAMKRLMLITPAVIILILLLLFMSFNSIRLALLVLLNLPFAMMGGIFALWISGLYLSVPASVGFIVLFGVAVLNGLVLVSYISQLQQEGNPLRNAISRACNFRLRPILMTASITVFSLIPMLYATGPGSEIQKPLAVVVVGGLFTSTLSTLIVLPSMFRWFDSKNKNDKEGRQARIEEPS